LDVLYRQLSLGFLPKIVHTAEWEMSVRAVANGRGMVNPNVLAGYRAFSAIDTGQVIRTTENLADGERLYAMLQGRHPSSPSQIVASVSFSKRFLRRSDSPSLAIGKLWPQIESFGDRDTTGATSVSG